MVDAMTSPESPWWLIVSLRNFYGITNFVETGTGRGHTSRTAATLFRSVHTVEINPDAYNESRLLLAELPNVCQYLGDSSKILPEIVLMLSSSSLFLLDGHWCGGDRYAVECPILDEIAAITKHSDDGDCVVIDDANCFIRPPGAPHRSAEWPSIAAVVSALRAGNRWSIQRVCNTIVATPHPIIEVF